MSQRSLIVDITPRSGSSSHRPGFSKPRLAAEDANLHLVLNGSIRYSGNAGKGTAQAGDLVAIPMGLTFCEADGPLQCGVTLAVVHARLAALPLWPDRITIVRPKATEQTGLLTMGEQLATAARAWKRGDALAGLEARGLAQALIATWFRISGNTYSTGRAWAAPLLEQIENNLADPNFVIADVANCAGLSRSQFCRRFSAAVGLPPARYLEARRMRRAMHQLAAGTSVNATAQLCGYDDPYHFSRVFKRSTGLAPRHWQATLERA